MSWCLANDSQLLDDVAQANRFSVNVLAADQLALSNRMAGAGSHVLQHDEFDESAKMVRRFCKDALAQFDCHIHEQCRTLGDHIMLVGGIDTVRHCSQGRAPLLMYFRGNYAGIDVGACRWLMSLSSALGVMGYPMAGHLAAAGHRVTVYNRTS